MKKCFIRFVALLSLISCNCHAGALVDAVLNDPSYDPVNPYWQQRLADAQAAEAAFEAGVDALDDANMNYQDSGWWGNWWGSAPDCAEIGVTMGGAITNSLPAAPSTVVIYQAAGFGYWFGSEHTYFIVVTPSGTYIVDPWYYNDTDYHPVDVDNLPYPPSYLVPFNKPIVQPPPPPPEPPAPPSDPYPISYYEFGGP